MSTMKQEENLQNCQESNVTMEDKALGGDERSSTKTKRSAYTKTEKLVTLHRKKKKKSDGEQEVTPEVSKEEDTFNWRNCQWQSAVCRMNCKIVTSLTPGIRKYGQKTDAVTLSHRPRIRYQKIESGIVQLPSMEVPSEWILKSSTVER